MTRSIYTCTCSLLAALTLLTGNSLSTAEELDSIISDVSEYWSPVIEDGKVEPPVDISTEVLGDAITPAQMLTPQRRTSNRVAQRPSRGSDRRSSSGLSKVPFMIGDTGAGTCTTFSGFLIDAELAHPTMACGRLNISENNTPIPTDRFFISYRHFENATPVRVFQFQRDYDVDRYTMGAEHTFHDGLWSIEMRLPLEHRLSSDFQTIDRALGDGTFDIFSGGRRTELGNISMIFKALMYERCDLAVSAGLGVTLPTSQDFHYTAEIVDNITFPSLPGFTNTRSILADFVASNETVYLAPFLSWLYQPTQRFFHQGFLQFEVAGNPSHVKVTGDGFNSFFLDTDPNTTVDTVTVVPAPGRADLVPQTLMRLNLGWGYILTENPRADWINQLTALFEVHYTTTLNDASVQTIPEFTFDPFGGVIQTDILVGNRFNRIDIVNLVAGLSANCGGWVITNGITAPITADENRGFDLEYNLQIQKPF